MVHGIQAGEQGGHREQGVAQRPHDLGGRLGCREGEHHAAQCPAEQRRPQQVGAPEQRPGPAPPDGQGARRNTAATRPMGVASREVASPIGTNGTPSETLVVSASGAARARTAATAATRPSATTSGRGAGRPPPVTTTATASRAPSSALSQKMACQSATTSTRAPSTGPSTEPSSCTAPTTPSGMPRRSAGQRSATIARVAGTRPPPPMPCRTRPVTSTGRSPASAVIVDPTTKIAQAGQQDPLPATRSASRPMSGSTAM